MAAVDQVRQDIIDWNTQNVGGKAELFPRSWRNFYDTLSWRNASVHLPSGIATLVEEFGGEGQGTERWVVFSVNGDTLFKVDGEYTSWDGTDWAYADLEEVEAVQVMVTQYKKKPKNLTTT